MPPTIKTLRYKTPLNSIAPIVKRAAAKFIQKNFRKYKVKKAVKTVKKIRMDAMAAKIQKAFRNRTFLFRPQQNRLDGRNIGGRPLMLWTRRRDDGEYNLRLRPDWRRIRRLNRPYFPY